ncbi:MAG: FHA domain-containing protein [Dehalococcoidia bacterium]|nr:FHA domain-containing protein [Dehalococcoidia bacterium]
MSISETAALVIQAGLGGVEMIPLDGSRQILGRLPHADIELDNPFVSRRHAEIVYRETEFTIRDLGSRNGTFVDGAKIDAIPRPLQGGETVEFGRGQVVARFAAGSSTITLQKSDGDGSPSKLTSTGAATITPRGVDVNHLTRDVLVDGVPVIPPLSGKDYLILELLSEHPGRAVSKDEIASRGWPESPAGTVTDQEIAQRLSRIRRRIEPDPSSPRYLESIRGFGYKLIGGKES